MPSMTLNYQLRGYNIPVCMANLKAAWSTVPGFTFHSETADTLFFTHYGFTNRLFAFAFGNYYWGTRVYIRWFDVGSTSGSRELFSYPHDGMDNLTNDAAPFYILYGDNVLFVKVAGNIMVISGDNHNNWYGFVYNVPYERLETYYNDSNDYNNIGAYYPVIGATTQLDQFVLIPVFPRISGGSKVGPYPVKGVYGCTPFTTGDSFYTLDDGSIAYVWSNKILIKE